VCDQVKLSNVTEFKSFNGSDDAEDLKFSQPLPHELVHIPKDIEDRFWDLAHFCVDDQCNTEPFDYYGCTGCENGRFMCCVCKGWARFVKIPNSFLGAEEKDEDENAEDYIFIDAVVYDSHSLLMKRTIDGVLCTPMLTGPDGGNFFTVRCDACDLESCITDK
jgi:hypothetical protein